ncbi:hypothetical protein ACTXT7_011514 [Hymenolepis weldensis]
MTDVLGDECVTYTSVMFRRQFLGMMIDICLGIHVQTRKHTAGPPVDTVVEI